MRSATVVMVLALAGCSGSVPTAPEREAKPVEATVVLSVPNMT
jgi:hypothetical protein